MPIERQGLHAPALEIEVVGQAHQRAVDVVAVKPFAKPVTLAAVKADARFKDMALAKYPRLSVQPVTAQEWKAICAMGGVKE